MSAERSTLLNHLQKHRSYYLPSGDTYFLAGNQIFRVHRYFLERESHIFQKRFQSAGVPGGPRNGETESTAIVLEVPPAAFEKLLDIFYNPKYSIYDWPVKDWTTVIELAQMWGFPEVLELAIRELKKIDISLISRIVLYQRLNIDRSHLLPLYADLCKRPQALNNEESQDIGLATTVVIFNARERLRARPSDGGKSPLLAKLKDTDVHAILVALLGGATPSTSPPSG